MSCRQHAIRCWRAVRVGWACGWVTICVNMYVWYGVWVRCRCMGYGVWVCMSVSTMGVRCRRCRWVSTMYVVKCGYACMRMQRTGYGANAMSCGGEQMHVGGCGVGVGRRVQMQAYGCTNGARQMSVRRLRVRVDGAVSMQRRLQPDAGCMHACCMLGVARHGGGRRTASQGRRAGRGGKCVGGARRWRANARTAGARRNLVTAAHGVHACGRRRVRRRGSNGMSQCNGGGGGWLR